MTVRDGDPSIDAIHAVLRMQLMLSIGQQTDERVRWIMVEIATTLTSESLSRQGIQDRLEKLEEELAALMQPPADEP